MNPVASCWKILGCALVAICIGCGGGSSSSGSRAGSSGVTQEQPSGVLTGSSGQVDETSGGEESPSGVMMASAEDTDSVAMNASSGTASSSEESPPEPGLPSPAASSPTPTAPTSPAAEGKVTFALGAFGEIDFVRLYIGTAPGAYELTIDLHAFEIGDGEIVATDSGLASILSQPGVYYAALTAVDTEGRESVFSNELRVERF